MVVNANVAELPVTPATARSDTVPGLVTTGAATVSTAVPVTPSLVARIVSVPTANAVASPPPDTVATAGLLDAHVTVRPVSALPAESFSVAVSCCVAPGARLALAGLSVIAATGAGVTLVVPLATFDNAPNTASTFGVPRYATTWN